MGVTSHSSIELYAKEEIFARSIAAKLWERGRSDLSLPLESCRTRETFCHCLACGHVMKWLNRCDRFYCPMCVPRLAYRRRLTIEFWAEEVAQPKHLVLTARNRQSLTHEYVKWFKTRLSRLRRQQPNTEWRGGLYSLECTNEGKGWHLHLHLLVDADWVDPKRLSQQWGSLVGQNFAIVAVRDARDRSYLAEVCKYAVKGSQLSSWSGGDIAEFIDSFTGVRQFGVFGSLFKDRAKRAKLLEMLGPQSLECPECCSGYLAILDDLEELEYQCTGHFPRYCITRPTAVGQPVSNP